MAGFAGTSSIGRLFAATTLAVVMFIIANAYLARESRSIDRFGESVSENAGPSVVQLTAVHAALQNMTAGVGLAFNSAAEGHPIDRSFFAEDDGRLHAALSAYLALPFYPGEQALYRPIDENIDTFERAVDRTLVLLERGALKDARTTMRSETIPFGLRASAALKRVIDFDVAQITRMSGEMISVRRRFSFFSYGLDVLAVLVALVLILLTSRALTIYSRLAEERRLRAERRAGELEQFAGRIAHDLKNPLGALSLRLEVVRRRHDEETFSRLSQPVQSMNSMIDDLLDFALSGARPQPGTANIREVVDEAIAMLREEAASAETTVDASACEPVNVACSRGALTSVITNLLHNALKFIVEKSGERKITIRAGERGGRVRVEMEDTGPGIPPGTERSVFEPFFRGAGSKAGGFGLGLATVRRIVEACGGSVGVESRLGQGSTFFVELPAAPPPASE
ncbi:MAG TPA: HAMP domain-containing sensor histidine kinase [Polyangia bacterium]